MPDNTEREAVVEHMRQDANGWAGCAYNPETVNAIKLLADEIERGDHLPTPTGDKQ